MTDPTPASGAPSPSAVRRSGDDYQDLHVWGAAMLVLREDTPYTQVDVEINGVGNVDDVVLRGPVGDRYGQVKWSTETASRVDEDFLTSASGNSKSLLQKFFAAYGKLLSTGATAFTMELITNRALDRDHLLLAHVDGRTDMLVPYAADQPAGSEAGRALQDWVDHVGCTREELLALLGRLRLRTALTVSGERDTVLASMAAAGLEAKAENLRRGLDAAAEWVRGGRRTLTQADVQQLVNEMHMHRTDPASVLLVQAIDRDPHPEDATVAVDWVDLFNGSDARERVQPRMPDGWQQMDDELQQATYRLEAVGRSVTLVRGALRLATFFRVGTVLPHVRGHVLRYRQGDQVWSTNTPRIAIPEPTVTRREVLQGADLAVAVGVARDPSSAVEAHVRSTGLPVRHVLTVTPSGGTDDQAVNGPGQAVAYAQGIRELVRDEVDRHAVDGAPGDKVHLFLATPGGLALLLGHRWNRLPTTVVYEHLGVGRGYVPAFTVAG